MYQMKKRIGKGLEKEIEKGIGGKLEIKPGYLWVFLGLLLLLGAGREAWAQEPILAQWADYDEMDPFALSPETAQEDMIELLTPEEEALAAQTILADASEFSDQASLDVTGAFKDAAFREAIREALGLLEGEPITDVLCRQIQVLQLSQRGITSLEGAEYLTGMRELYSVGNPILRADLHGLKNLQVLILSQGKLEEIQVEGTNLVRLNVSDNQLRRLDLSGISTLEEVNAGRNSSLEELKLSGNPSLRRLLCSECSLGELSLSECSSLEFLECTHNRLLYLDLSGCPGLKELDVAYNDLTWLDLRGLELMRLDVRFNRMVTYHNVALGEKPELVFYSPQAGSELSREEYLGSDVTGDFQDPGFREAVRSLLFLGETDPITPRECLMITSMNLTQMEVHSLAGIEHFLNLSQLRCYGLSLDHLSLSGMKLLTELYCWESNLRSIDVSGCSALENLFCEKNRLTSLNLTGCGSLRYLYCYDNQLTNLDVTSCPALIHLDCQMNELQTLNLENNHSLSYANVSQNWMVSQGAVPLAIDAPAAQGGLTFLPQLSESEMELYHQAQEAKEREGEQAQEAAAQEAEKKKNKITLSLDKVTLSASPKKQVYQIDARAKKGSLTFRSNREEVRVTKKGKVKIPAGFTGTVKITITSQETKKYRPVSKTLKLKVKERAEQDGERVEQDGERVE